MSRKPSSEAIKLKLVSKAGPTQDSAPQMVFSVVSTGSEEKLQSLVQQIGPELFEGAKVKEDGTVAIECAEEFEDAEEDDLEEVKEEDPAAPGEFVVPVVAMPVFDNYGLPKDGFDYYKFIKTEVSGGDFIAAEPQPDLRLACDSDFGKKLNAQERAVLDALENAEEYESLSDDFLEEAAQTPEACSGEEEKEDFDTVAQQYLADGLEDDGPRPILRGAELDALMEEFKREHPDLMAQVAEEQPAPEVALSMPAPIPYEEDHCLKRLEVDEGSEDADEIAEKAYEKLAYREPEEPDDVESIVSTYTNTDNRPALISVKERKPQKKTKAEKQKPKKEEEADKQTPGAIPENETKEEKKQRKAALKEARRVQRQAKKELKQSFTSEKVRQLHQTSGKYDTPQGYSVIKIS